MSDASVFVYFWFYLPSCWSFFFLNPKTFLLLGLKDRPQFNSILSPHQMAKKLPSHSKRWASHTMLIRSRFPKAFSSRYFVCAGCVPSLILILCTETGVVCKRSKPEL